LSVGENVADIGNIFALRWLNFYLFQNCSNFAGCFRNYFILNRLKNSMRKSLCLAIVALIASANVNAETFELLKYGNFDNWLTRNIKESSLLGGNTKKVYEICPSGTDNTGNAYSNRGGSPWATSNVLASPAGITKTSNAVYPETRGSGKCAKLVCEYEHCKAIGFINIDVIVGGSIFLGKMLEPVKSTKNPYSKMEMGVAFTKRPKALRFDYKVSIPSTNQRIYSSGFGKKKTIAGSDFAEALIFLQRRWEDADGNLYAKRVGTAREQYKKSTSGWVNAHDLKIIYGNATTQPGYFSAMNLIPAEKSYYGRNSKGKLVPVKEVGWDDADATPTHVIVMFSAAGGEPYIGTLDLTLWVDNVGFVY
jgi:hypothetical protein